MKLTEGRTVMGTCRGISGTGLMQAREDDACGQFSAVHVGYMNRSNSFWFPARTPSIHMDFVIVRGWEIIGAVTCNVEDIRESAFEASLVLCECAPLFIC